MKLVSFISKSEDEVFINPEHVSRLEMCATRPELYTEVYHPNGMTLVQGRSHDVAHRLADEVVFPREAGAPPMHEPFTCPECGSHHFGSTRSGKEWLIHCHGVLEGGTRCEFIGEHDDYVTSGAAAPDGDGEG